MKKIFIALTGLFLTMNIHAQDRPQPTPGPAPVVNVKKPKTFSLSNGLKVLVVEDNKLPRVSFNLSIDTAPYAEGTKKGVSDLTSALLGKGSKKISKEDFNEEVDFLGARLSFSASGAYASTLSKYAPRVLELMAEGALNPNFTQEELEKEREQILEGLKSQEKSVAAVANRVQGVLTYGKNHPSGEFVSEETINNITLEDVKNNYETYFAPGRAYLVVMGDIKFKDVEKMVKKHFNRWKKAAAPNISYSDPKNVQFTQINFVDMPNAVQSEITLVNTVRLEMKDADYFPALLANQVLGGDFNSYLNMNLREANGWTYGARSSIYGSRYLGDFSASSQVRNAVTDSAVVEFIKEIKRIRTEKVKAEDLANVKAGYIGRFVMQVDKPQTIARFALNIETEGLPADFYTNYIKSINAVTPEDIQRVANKYFMADNMRIVIVGKGSEVIPALEKTGLPILYFDKFGTPTAKPEMKREAPKGVTLQSVMDNYIKAIGGEKAIAGVKSMAMKGSATIPGAPAPITMVSKRTANGKSLTIINMEGMGELSKQVVNDKGGYSSGQGQRVDLTAEEFAEAKAKGLFSERTMAKDGKSTLEGIESINGTDAYVVKSGKQTFYYDVATGLKISESTDEEVQGQKMQVVISYGDYREVKGIKVPHQMSVNQGIEIDFKMAEVKINEGVSDADFM